VPSPGQSALRAVWRNLCVAGLGVGGVLNSGGRHCAVLAGLLLDLAALASTKQKDGQTSTRSHAGSGEAV